MSVYASTFGLGYEHKPRCAKMRKIGRKVYQENDSKQCTCGSSPLIYQGSHILPHDRDKNGGTLGLGAIPAHIHRSGRDRLSSDMHPYHPWLRISFDGAEDAAMILTRKQVIEFRQALTDWLELSQPVPRRNRRLGRAPSVTKIARKS